MWRQYSDLYAGGEQFRQNAAEYLVRRQKEPLDVYQERLTRVFYENYIGSIIDWYTATLVRREPMLEFEGSERAREELLHRVRAELRPERDDADEFFRQQLTEALVCGKSLHRGGFSAGERAGADAGRRRRQRAKPRIPGGLHGGRSHQLELRSTRTNWNGL